MIFSSHNISLKQSLAGWYQWPFS